MTQVKTSSAVAPVSGSVVFATATKVVQHTKNGCLVISPEGYLVIIDDWGNAHRIVLPYGAAIQVEPNAFVHKGKTLATWCPHTTPIIAETCGHVSHIGFEEGVSVAREVDEVSGLAIFVVLGKKGGKQRSRKNTRIAIDPDRDGEQWGQVTRTLPVGTQIYTAENKFVERGDILARMFNE